MGCGTHVAKGAKSGCRGPRRSKRWSGKRDSNPRLRPWQGRTLPLSYSRPVSNDSRYHSPKDQSRTRLATDRPNYAGSLDQRKPSDALGASNAHGTTVDQTLPALERDSHNVKAARTPEQALPSHIVFRHRNDPPLLPRRDRFRCRAESGAKPCLDLHEHQHACLAGHDINLASPGPVPSGKNLVPASYEFATRQVLSGLSKGYTVPAEHAHTEEQGACHGTRGLRPTSVSSACPPRCLRARHRARRARP